MSGRMFPKSRKGMTRTLLDLMKRSGVEPFSSVNATWHMTPRLFRRVCKALGNEPVLDHETRLFGFPVQVEGDHESLSLMFEVRYPQPESWWSFI